MSGFLDKETRIVDMVITGEGRRLLSQGKLGFTYWMLFDDEVDYDPFVSSSSSLSGAELSASVTSQIEETLVREATSGYKVGNKPVLDRTNVNRPMFTAPQGYKVLPSVVGMATGSVSVGVRLRKVQELLTKRGQSGEVIDQVGPIDRGYQRFDPSSVKFDPRLIGYPPDYDNDGFLVRVFVSGSDGFTEVREKLDSLNNISFNHDMIAAVRNKGDI